MLCARPKANLVGSRPTLAQPWQGGEATSSSSYRALSSLTYSSCRVATGLGRIQYNALHPDPFKVDSFYLSDCPSR
jgi:hypothetical protein